MRYNSLRTLHELKKQDKERMRLKLENIKTKTMVAEHEYREIFEDLARYVDIRIINDWMEKYKNLHDDATSLLTGGMIEKVHVPWVYEEYLKRISNLYKKIRKKREKHNRLVLSGDKEFGRKCFKEIGVKLPDTRQLSAVIKRDKFSVITGAPGSGLKKTLVAKVRYVIETAQCSPSQAVILVHNEIAVKNIENLFEDKQKPTIETYTEFAQEILRKIGETIPKVENPDIFLTLRKYFNEKLSTGENVNRLVDYYFTIYRCGLTVFDFTNVNLFEVYLKDFPPISLRGEIMASYEEMDVANFLYRNGVEYLYKEPYDDETVIQGPKGRYKPTFYLPKEKIYLNVFELDINGKAAKRGVSFFSNEAYTEKYRLYINEIREMHRQNEDVLVECYTYEKSDESLLYRLNQKLEDCNISYNPKDSASLWAEIKEKEIDLIDNLAQSLCGVFEMARAGGFSGSDIIDINRSASKVSDKSYKKNEILLSFMLPCYNEYCENYSASTGVTDCYDLINYATANVLSHKKDLGYKYIFVDDFQDISVGKCNLLRSVIQCCEASLFCIGSDWISNSGRFGTDLSFLYEIGRYFPGYDYSELQWEYGLPLQIIKSMHGFITKNKDQSSLMPICKYAPKGKSLEILTDSLQDYLDSITPTQTVLLVGRYQTDEEILKDLKLNEKTKFVTVHNAEEKADIVILINTRRVNMGFPDSILQQNKLIDLLSVKPEYFPNAGERRLFCKVMSLAKTKVVFWVQENNISPFVKELIEDMKT